MKIHYNSKIAKIFTFLKDFKVIMLFGDVFTEDSSMSESVEYHERAHCEQYQTLFSLGAALSLVSMFVMFAFNIYGLWMISFLAVPFLFFYLWYLVEYIIRLLMYWNHKKAYRNIAFEREAFDLQYEYKKECGQRRFAKSFSFFKYYNKKFKYDKKY